MTCCISWTFWDCDRGRVELTLEKELYDSFGEEERLLLCSLYP